MASPMVGMVNVELIKKVEEMALKHTDLLCNRLSENALEIVGTSFYYDRHDPMATHATVRILAIRNVATEGMVSLQLQCLKKDLKCLIFTGENMEEATKFIANLSFFGIRHYFCGGFDLQPEDVAIGPTAIVQYQEPYMHFRHRHCAMFFLKRRATQNPVSLCLTCNHYKANRHKQLQKRVPQHERVHLKSHVPIMRLSDSEKRQRLKFLVEESKSNKQKLKRLMKKTQGNALKK